MTETRTERGSCKFIVQQVEGGKQAIVVQTFHDNISPLKHAVLGFNLLSGITSEQAKTDCGNIKRVRSGGISHDLRLASHVQGLIAPGSRFL
jgi:hypothetical protein